MVSDEDTVMEYSSSGSIFLVKSQEYLRQRIFLLGGLTLTGLWEPWKEDVSCCSVQSTRWRPSQTYISVQLCWFRTNFFLLQVFFWHNSEPFDLYWPRSARSVHAAVIIIVWVQTFFINSNPVSSLDPAAIVPLNSILKLLSNYVPETRMVYRALWRQERFCFYMDGLGLTFLCSTIKAWQNHYTCKAVHCCRLKIQMDVVVSSDGLGIIAPTVSKKSVGLVRVKMWADCNKVTILLYS